MSQGVMLNEYVEKSVFFSSKSMRLALFKSLIAKCRVSNELAACWKVSALAQGGSCGGNVNKFSKKTKKMADQFADSSNEVVADLCQAWIDLNSSNVLVPLADELEEITAFGSDVSFQEIKNSEIFLKLKSKLGAINDIDLAFGISLFLNGYRVQGNAVDLNGEFCDFWNKEVGSLTSLDIESTEWKQLDCVYRHLSAIKVHKQEEYCAINELKSSMDEFAQKNSKILEFFQVSMPDFPEDNFDWTQGLVIFEDLKKEVAEYNQVRIANHTVSNRLDARRGRMLEDKCEDRIIELFKLLGDTFADVNMSMASVSFQKGDIEDGFWSKNEERVLAVKDNGERIESVVPYDDIGKNIENEPDSLSQKEEENKASNKVIDGVNDYGNDDLNYDDQERDVENEEEFSCVNEVDDLTCGDQKSEVENEEGFSCVNDADGVSVNDDKYRNAHSTMDPVDLNDSLQEMSNVEDDEIEIPFDVNDFIENEVVDMPKLGSQVLGIFKMLKTGEISEDDSNCAVVDDRSLISAFLVEKYNPTDSGEQKCFLQALYLGLNYNPDSKISEKILSIIYSDKFVWEKLPDISVAMFLSAALIRPTLYSPHIASDYVWGQINDVLADVAGCTEFVTAILDFKKRSFPLPVNLTVERNNIVSLKQRLDDVDYELEKWLETAPKRKFSFEDANRFWKSWVSESGDLGRLVRTSMSDSFDILVLKEKIHSCDVRMFDRALVDEAARLNRHQTIKYAAKGKIKKLFFEVVDLMKRKVDLKEQLDVTSGNSFLDSQKLFSRTQKSAGGVYETIKQMRFDAYSVESYASRIFLHSLHDLICGFDKTPFIQNLNDPYDILRYHELSIPELVCGVGEAIGGIYDSLKDISDPYIAFKGHLEQGSFFEAKELQEYVAKQDREVIGWDVEFSEAREVWKKRLYSHLIDMEERLGNSLLKGVVDPQKHAMVSRDLQNCESEINRDRVSPIELVTKLHSVRDELDLSAELRRDSASKRLESFLAGGNLENISHFRKIEKNLSSLINKDEFTFFDEVLAEIGKVEQVEGDEILAKFRPANTGLGYIEFIEAVEGIAGVVSNDVSLDRAHERTKIVDLLPNVASRDNAEALKNWTTLDRTFGPRKFRHLDPKSLFSLLRWLGFRIDANARQESVRGEGSPYHWSYVTVQAAIKSPLPIFGSNVTKHTCLFVWGEVTEASLLLQQLDSFYTDTDQSLFIFFFNGLRCEQRENFMFELRKKEYCPIIVDRYLLLWLSNITDYVERTRTLFRVGLAGASYNPYTPEVAGAVPNEMFFGRGTDIQELWKVDGPCIVYGGRQLGKSALLLQVKKQFNCHKEQRFVFYQGMKTKSDFWKEIHNKILSVPEFRVKRVNRNISSIQDLIRSIVVKNPGIRLVFLFDECDEILDQDSYKDFDQVSHIRDLMNETDRRFKVIFAGLHSVHRFTKIPNQPLAHFGDPICVGPLEGAAAEQLIRVPMDTLGYSFELDSLVHRILAHTNRHPSLIQFFCKELIAAMLKPSSREDVFLVTEDIISRVYRSANLMRRMRERFDWTLDLDKRYRAIGYAIAYLHVDSGEDNPDNEYSIAEIESQVKEVWPVGFEDTSLYEMHGLLEELVGLGVLIEVSTNKYSLRSPNVLHLLGGVDDIVNELVRLENEPRDDRNNYSVIHRIINSSNREHAQISPFTVTQERLLQGSTDGIVMVYGTEALGLGELENYLPKALLKDSNGTEPKVYVLNYSPDITDKMRGYRKGSRSDTYFIIDADGFTQAKLENLMDDTLGWMGKHNSERVRSRVIIKIPIFQFASTYLRREEFEAKYPQIEKIVLKPWKEASIERFFDDINVVPGEGRVAELLKQTNGWPSILLPCLISYMQDRRSVAWNFDCRPLLRDCGIQNVHPKNMEIYEVISELGGVSEYDIADLLGYDRLPYIDMLKDMNLIERDLNGYRAERVLGIVKEIR